MYKITIMSLNKTIICKDNYSVLDALVENNIFINNNCMGHGICGKCKIKLISGIVNEINSDEERFLDSKEIKSGIRLCCFLFPKGDISIEIIDKKYNYEILSHGFIPTFSPDPSIQKLIKYNNTLVYYNDILLCTESGNTTNRLYGIALDIGTTTVVMSLIDLNTCKEIFTEVSINAQIKYGQDVISRISYANSKGEEGILTLKNSITELINEMIYKLCLKANICNSDIYEVDVSANTTMLHMLLGVSAAGIAKSPYKPAFLASRNIKANELGININSFGVIYCLPSVSAYVGADIVSGIYSSSFYKQKSNSLYIDIGTNTEIVLIVNDKMFCCSCAAGPALEGMNISNGMKATAGAIEGVKIDDTGIEIEVIGNEKPVGICGSGIISIISELIRNKIIKENGRIIDQNDLDANDYRNKYIISSNNKRSVILTADGNPITVSQNDIRQVQLSKAAILAGIYSLIEEAKISYNSIDKIVIAGQFGLHLTSNSLTGCGIIPKALENKITYIGNTSKSGAIMSLLSRSTKNEMNKIIPRIQYLELSMLNTYKSLFIKCMNFNTY